MMIYHDLVYGSAKIKHPLLLEILESHAMKRLQGVLQHGISALVGITSAVSRFEHSLGVMMLVRKMDASLEEQIAALLHDISHTAFSHVIDYVFNGHETQSYHEDHKLAYVSGTDIPDILQKHGYRWNDFMQESNFPLLEQDLPRLCADRLDYFLRDAKGLGIAGDLEVSNTLAHLIPFQGRIIVDDLDAARWLGYTFIQCDKASWANFREVGLYELAAMAIRRGLEIGVLTEDDIWGTDLPAWEKLRLSSDPILQYHYQRVSADTEFVWDEENPEFRVSTKLRSIDPDVLIDGKAVPLSTLDSQFDQHRNQYLAENSGKWPIRVIASNQHTPRNQN